MPRLRPRVLRIYHSAVVPSWRRREVALTDRGFEVVLVAPRRWNEGSADVRLIPDQENDSLVAVRTFGRHPALFLYDPRPIRRLLRNGNWSLLDIHEEPFSLAAAEILLLRWLYARRVPVVMYTAQNIYKRYPLPIRWLERRAIRATSLFYACSTGAAEVLRRKGAGEKARVVPLGVDLDAYSPEEFLETGPLRVGYVGRLARVKGVHVLLNALAPVPTATLEIVGDGEERPNLEALARELGISDRVNFNGAVGHADLPELYREFDIVAVPSLPSPGWTEQFCRVAIEAMASGVPVVVSDEGALPEVVGEAGVLVAAGDVEALANALAHLAQDPENRRRLRDKAIERSRQYSWEAVGAAHADVYRAALAEGGPAWASVRVAYLDHCAQLSGGEIALANLLPTMPVEKLAVFAEDGPIIERFRASGTKTVVLPMDESVRNLSRSRVSVVAPLRAVIVTARYAFRLSRWLRANDVDLVHTNSLKATVYGVLAARLAGVPVVSHVRDRIAPDYLNPRSVRWLRWWIDRVPDATIANSRTTLGTLRGSRAQVVPSPVVPDPILLSPETGQARGQRHIVMIGRIAPWKGQHVFVDAFDRAFPDRDATATIVGSAMFGDEDRAYDARVRAMVAERGLEEVLGFAGFVDDVRPILHEATALVHASVTAEPFGQVVFEAMAAGVPVIAPDLGGPAEYIEHERNGLLYPVADATALADCMRRLIDDDALRQRLSKEGRDTVAALDPDHVAAQVLDVYGAVLRREASRRRPLRRITRWRARRRGRDDAHA